MQREAFTLPIPRKQQELQDELPEVLHVLDDSLHVLSNFGVLGDAAAAETRLGAKLLTQARESSLPVVFRVSGLDFPGVAGAEELS